MRWLTWYKLSALVLGHNWQAQMCHGETAAPQLLQTILSPFKSRRNGHSKSEENLPSWIKKDGNYHETRLSTLTRLELLSVQRIDGSNQIIFVHRCILYPGNKKSGEPEWCPVSKHQTSPLPPEGASIVDQDVNASKLLNLKLTGNWPKHLKTARTFRNEIVKSIRVTYVDMFFRNLCQDLSVKQFAWRTPWCRPIFEDLPWTATPCHRLADALRHKI